MGQQQLLLIILGVMLVGMAIYGGIQYMGQQNSDACRDRCRFEALQLCTDADQYKLMPKAMGGGGGSYDGMSYPKFYVDEPDILYSMTATGQYLQISASSYGPGAVLGDDGRTPVAILLTKNGDAMRIDKLN